jgi:hypothetical protein
MIDWALMEPIPGPMDAILYLAAKFGVATAIVTAVASIAALHDWFRAGKIAAARAEQLMDVSKSSPRSFVRLVVLQTLFLSSTVIISRTLRAVVEAEAGDLGDTWSDSSSFLLNRAMLSPFDSFDWIIFCAALGFVVIADIVAPYSSDTVNAMSILVVLIAPGGAIGAIMAVVKVNSAHHQGVTTGSLIVGVVAPLVIVAWWWIAGTAVSAPARLADAIFWSRRQESP